MIEDPRKTGLKNGLRQLTNDQIKKVVAFPNDGKFCPLAVALDRPTTLIEPINEKVIQTLETKGYKVFNTRGILGEFYTNNRYDDLIQAANEVLSERDEG